MTPTTPSEMTLDLSTERRVAGANLTVALVALFGGVTVGLLQALEHAGLNLYNNGFAAGLPFALRPQVSMMAPSSVSKVNDATGLLVDQRDVTPMALAFQARGACPPAREGARPADGPSKKMPEKTSATAAPVRRATSRR